MTEEKDLGKTCEHYWLDFPMSLDRRPESIRKELDDFVPYPCLKCTFDSYTEKK